MTANLKPTFAMYWAASCGGCEIAVLNIYEKILDVDAAFDVVFWPVAMDTKYHDVEAMPDESITLTLFNGGIRNTENEELAHLLRRKSKVLVAFGSCACEGCIPGLANLSTRQQIFDRVYTGISTENPDDVRPQPFVDVPEGTIHIPQMLPLQKTLDQVVPVDYYLPGCPPESHQIAAVIDLIIDALAGEASLPPVGSVIGVGNSTVCDECLRTRNVKTITEFKRIQHVAGTLDPDVCLLEQGIPCNGPATQSGCGALCPQAGAQCIGCYGPPADTRDFGARLMSAFASVIEGETEAEIERVLDTLPDLPGQFYRFSLPNALLRGTLAAIQEEEDYETHTD